jgi:hypothetical protein
VIAWERKLVPTIPATGGKRIPYAVVPADRGGLSRSASTRFAMRYRQRAKDVHEKASQAKKIVSFFERLKAEASAEWRANRASLHERIVMSLIGVRPSCTGRSLPATAAWQAAESAAEKSYEG